MAQTKLQALAQLGQSIWLDYIDRKLLDTGQLKNWIEQGLRGMTSNPTIFCKAIASSTDYDERILKLKEAGKSTFEIYDELTIRDIQEACDLFRPVYKETDRLDGYVSLEINPLLAHDTEASIKEGLRLFEKVHRPNCMIKVPSTKAGFPVIEALLAKGVNVNVTLIFSLKQYTNTAQAFLKGMERLSQKYFDLRKVHSVASVFVSRMDTLTDKLIEDRLKQGAASQRKEILSSLKGRAAVANSQLIFNQSKEHFASDRFQKLAQKGAAWQRVLWGSTSTKNPAYRDIKYLTELIAPSTVNTVPQNTLGAFLDHGEVLEALQGTSPQAQELFQTLKKFDIDIEAVCAQLLDDGVAAFSQSFEELINSIETKARQLITK